jgi:hypothetical protein
MGRELARTLVTGSPIDGRDSTMDYRAVNA